MWWLLFTLLGSTTFSYLEETTHSCCGELDDHFFPVLDQGGCIDLHSFSFMFFLVVLQGLVDPFCPKKYRCWLSLTFHACCGTLSLGALWSPSYPLLLQRDNLGWGCRHSYKERPRIRNQHSWDPFLLLTWPLAPCTSRAGCNSVEHL